MAVLLDVDERLCAALLGLLRAVVALSHRSRGHGPRAVAGGPDRDRRAGAWLARLRFALPLAALGQRAAARARGFRLCRGDELGLHACLLRPRRAHPHWR